MENQCCKILLRQLEAMEVLLKNLKEMNKSNNAEYMNLDLTSLEQGIVDAYEQIEEFKDGN